MEKNEKIPEKKRFSIIARLRSSDNALRGLSILIKTGHHFWIELFFIILGVYTGFVLHLSSIEWAIMTIMLGLVVVCEAINTAIEIDIDLTSPGYHPYARDAKDVAAGAVSITIIMAGIVGAIIYLPKLIAIL